MGEWEKIPIGKLCKITKGRQLNKIDLLKSGDYPCLNGGIEPSGYTAEWNTEANTITISEGGNSCGYINFMRTRFWSGGHCYSLLDIIDDINRSFFYQALKGNEKSIMALRVGSGLPNIQRKALASFEITYPTSKLEQSKISEILSTVDKAIEQTVQLIEKYKRIKTGLMQDLLTKGIDERGNIRSEQTHKFKDSPLGKIPVEWGTPLLGEIFNEFRTGATPRRNNPTYWYDGTILWVTSGELKYKIIYDTLEKITHEAVKESNLIIYPPSTFFIAITGLEAEGTRGSCALIGKEATTNQSCMAFQSNEKIDVQYLYQYYLYWGKHISLRYAQGTKQQSLNGNIVKSITIKLPIDLIEQRRIVRALENYDSLIISLQSNLAKMYHIKSGLMQGLLTGNVKVSEELINEINKLNIN